MKINEIWQRELAEEEDKFKRYQQTIEQAEAARLQKIIPEEYRIAEPYTIIRYKPVRPARK